MIGNFQDCEIKIYFDYVVCEVVNKLYHEYTSTRYKNWLMNKNEKHKIKTLQIFRKHLKINVEKLSKIRSSIDS